MMERSSRFISLGGWSEIAAGGCVLVGAWLANKEILERFKEIHGYSRYPRIKLLQEPDETFQEILGIFPLISRLIW